LSFHLGLKMHGVAPIWEESTQLWFQTLNTGSMTLACGCLSFWVWIQELEILILDKKLLVHERRRQWGIPQRTCQFLAQWPRTVWAHRSTPSNLELVRTRGKANRLNVSPFADPYLLDGARSRNNSSLGFSLEESVEGQRDATHPKHTSWEDLHPIKHTVHVEFFRFQ